LINSINPGVLIAIIAAVVVVILLIALLIFLKVNKNDKLEINDEYIDELVKAFGGASNIKGVKTENGGRVAVEVNDLELLNNDKIKELATSGVFITGNIVKTLYREDSQLVVKAMEVRI